MLRREIVLTQDGSASIRLPDWGEGYHSQHGALQEAIHVFIKNGLDHFDGRVSILEMGFGTGLNALIAYAQSESRNLNIDYTGVDAFPVTLDEASLLNYPQMIGHRDVFELMHRSPWEEQVKLSPAFKLTKIGKKFQDLDLPCAFDLIFFDAFGYPFQPELWSAEIFKKMHDALLPGGALVTYAARSVIRRNMEMAGLTVVKVPGPPGKREMMRAIRPI